MQKRILQFYFYKRYFSTDLALPSTIKFKICFKVTEKLDLQNSLKFKKNIQVIYIYKIKKKKKQFSTFTKQKGNIKSTIKSRVLISK